MDKETLERVTNAINAERQDDEAQELYWTYIESPDSKELLSEAYCLLYVAWHERRNYDGLHALVETACQRRLADPDAISFIAEGEFQANRFDNALKLYDRLLLLNSLDAQSYQHLKLACFQHRPFDDFANLLLLRCFKEHPDDESVLQFLYSQYLLHDQFTHTNNAIPIYQRILEQEPANIAARVALCESFYRHGRYDQAEMQAETGLSYEKQHPDLLAVLAKVHNERGEYGRVVNYCRDVLAKRPGRSDMQILLAEVYARNTLTTTEAIKNYEIALRLEPNHALIRLALFRSYMRKLQLDDAIEQTKQIVALLHEQHGTSKREFQQAIKEMLGEYERAMRREPDDMSLYLITAKLNEYIGHFHKALLYYRRILEFPLNTPMIEKLIELFEKLATFRVQNPHLFLYLGLLYHKLGRRSEARQAFRTVMYSDLDEHEVEDLLVQHDRSIWAYPAVLVILAHHGIVTKDVLDGLMHAFDLPEKEDWNGVLWVLRELYNISELLPELRQLTQAACFPEIYQHVIPLFAYNGSGLAIQTLQELLLHEQEEVRQEALNALFQMEDNLAEQVIMTMARKNPHDDIRLEIAGYFSQQTTEQATNILLKMMRDSSPKVRLHVAQSLQKRRLPSTNFREALFTEDDLDVKIELIHLIAGLQAPEEWSYLAHLLNDLVAQRYHDKGGSGKVYARFKQFIGHAGRSDDLQLLSALIHAIGLLKLEDGVNGLSVIAEHDRSQLLRIEAIETLARIGADGGVPVLQRLIDRTTESEDIHAAAQEALNLLTA